MPAVLMQMDALDTIPLQIKEALKTKLTTIIQSQVSETDIRKTLVAASAMISTSIGVAQPLMATSPESIVVKQEAGNIVLPEAIKQNMTNPLAQLLKGVTSDKASPILKKMIDDKTIAPKDIVDLMANKGADLLTWVINKPECKAALIAFIQSAQIPEAQRVVLAEQVVQAIQKNEKLSADQKRSFIEELCTLSTLPLIAKDPAKPLVMAIVMSAVATKEKLGSERATRQLGVFAEGNLSVVPALKEVLTVTPRLETNLRAAFPSLFDKIIRETLNDQQSKSEQIRDVVWKRSSIEKAPTLRLGDTTYQGFIDLIEYYKNQPTLAQAHQSDILDYFSELFSASQFTGFIEPMVQFINEHNWDKSTSWVSDQMVNIPREIATQDDFSIILKQSQLIALIPSTASTSSWRETIRKPIESFLKQLPPDQVPMIANQLPTWVLQLIVIDYPEKPSNVSSGRIELLIREVNKILAIRLMKEERKSVTDAIDRWVEAIQQSDPIKIKSAELAIKIAMNKPNQTIIALLRPLNEWINSHPDMAPTYLEKMEQLSLYYQAVPTMRQLLAKLAANPSYTLSEIDRAYIRSWWPVIEPFLRDKIEENILEDLRTPICSHVKKLEGLLGSSRDAIIKSLQSQLRERS